SLRREQGGGSGKLQLSIVGVRAKRDDVKLTRWGRPMGTRAQDGSSRQHAGGCNQDNDERSNRTHGVTSWMPILIRLAARGKLLDGGCGLGSVIRGAGSGVRDPCRSVFFCDIILDSISEVQMRLIT